MEEAGHLAEKITFYLTMISNSILRQIDIQTSETKNSENSLIEIEVVMILILRD